MKKNIIHSWQMTRKDAREFLDLYEKKHENKYRLPREGYSLNICEAGNPNLVSIFHAKGVFIVEHFNYVTK